MAQYYGLFGGGAPTPQDLLAQLALQGVNLDGSTPDASVASILAGGVSPGSMPVTQPPAPTPNLNDQAAPDPTAQAAQPGQQLGLFGSGAPASSLTGSDPTAGLNAAMTDPSGYAPSLPAVNLPPVPAYHPLTGLGAVADSVLLDGRIGALRAQQFEAQKQNFQLALARAQMQRQIAAEGALPAQLQPYAILNPEQVGEEGAKNAAPVTTPEGATTTMYGGTTQFTAPKLVLDPTSGALVTQTPNFAHPTGQLGGDYKVDSGSGGMYSARTGQVTGVLPQFHSAAVTDNAGFNAPNGAAIDPAFTGGQGAAAGVASGLNGPQPPVASGGAGYNAGVRLLESSNNNSARNGTSSGLYGFKPQTFQSLVPGGDITNPADEERAMNALTAQNAATLQKAGLPVTNANLYLLHQQGPAVGVALLKNPNGNAIQIAQQSGAYSNPRVAASAIVGNGGNGNMSAAQFASMWGGKLAQAMGGGGQGAPASQTSPNGITSGWQGRGYVMNPNGTKTAPNGDVTAGPNFVGPEQVASIRKTVYGDTENTEAVQATSALNSLYDAIKRYGGNNGVINTAAVANLSRMETGLSARQGTMDTVMNHFGVPDVIQNQFSKTFGNAPISVGSLNNLVTMMKSYASAKRAIAQHRFDNESATYPGVNLNLQLPQLSPEPAVKWFNGGQPSGNGAPPPRPNVGDVRKGYRYTGGDPSSPASWAKVG